MLLLLQQRRRRQRQQQQRPKVLLFHSAGGSDPRDARTTPDGAADLGLQERGGPLRRTSAGQRRVGGRILSLSRARIRDGGLNTTSSPQDGGADAVRYT
jgi:hypothetical protein